MNENIAWDNIPLQKYFVHILQGLSVYTFYVHITINFEVKQECFSLLFDVGGRFTSCAHYILCTQCKGINSSII